MNWLWENIAVPRILLLFLFGVGIAWTLDTIARPLLKKRPKTTNHHLDNGDKNPDQKQLNQKGTGIKLIIPREDVKEQVNIANTKDGSENYKNST
jgi:hypothetical protein